MWRSQGRCEILCAVYDADALRVRPWMVWLGALSLLTPFLRATSTFFISDDIQMVLFGATTDVAEIAWLPSSRWTWHRPLPAFSWILNYAAAGEREFWWHVPNLLLHAANIALAWTLTSRLTASRVTATLTALLFAWSPVTPGTVTWISARPDLLAMCFVLASLNVAYAPALGGRPPLRVAALLACVLLAISSKESAFGLLPIAVVLYVAPRVLPVDPRWRAPLALPAVVIVVMGSFLVARFLLYGSTLGGYGLPLSVRRLVSAPLLAPVAVLSVVRLLAGTTAHGWLMLAAGAAGSLGLLRVAPVWTLAGLCAVLPAAHLVAASLPLWEYDRFYYMASFWIAGALATAITALYARGTRRTAVAVAGILVVCSLVYLAVRLDGLQEASAVTRRVDTTLRGARTSLPSGAVILCAGLPDSVEAAYAYRNGCVEHVALVWPDKRVSAAMRPVDVPSGVPLFGIDPDGSALVALAPTTTHDAPR